MLDETGVLNSSKSCSTPSLCSFHRFIIECGIPQPISSKVHFISKPRGKQKKPSALRSVGLHRAFRAGSAVWERLPQHLFMLPWPAERAMCFTTAEEGWEQTQGRVSVATFSYCLSICKVPSPHNSTPPLSSHTWGEESQEGGKQSNNGITVLRAEAKSNALIRSGPMADSFLTQNTSLRMCWGLVVMSWTSLVYLTSSLRNHHTPASEKGNQAWRKSHQLQTEQSESDVAGWCGYDSDIFSATSWLLSPERQEEGKEEQLEEWVVRDSLGKNKMDPCSPLL